MNRINRCSQLIALCMMAAMIVTGCTNGPLDSLLGNEGTSSQNSGQSGEPEPLTIWSMTDSVKYTFEGFEDRHHSVMTYVALEGDDPLGTRMGQLTVAGEDTPDILVLTQEQMLQQSVQDIAMDLGPIEFRHGDAGYSIYQEELIRNEDKQIKGLAYNVSPMVLAYRRSVARDVFGTDDPQVVGNAFASMEQIKALGSQLKEGQVLFDNPYVMHYFATVDNLMEVLEATSQMKVDRRFGTTVNWTDEWLTGMTKAEGSLESPVALAYPVPAWAVEEVMMMASTDGNQGNPTGGDWGIAQLNMEREWDNGFYLVVTKASKHKGLAMEWVEEMLFDSTRAIAFATANGHIPSTKTARQMIERHEADDFLGGQSFMNRVIAAQDAVDALAGRKTSDVQQDRVNNQKIEALFVDYVDGNYHTPTEAYDTFMTELAASQENQDSQEGQ